MKQRVQSRFATRVEDRFSNTLKNPQRKPNSMHPITPARDISILFILHREKSSPETMHLTTPINTDCSLHGPNRVFGESRRNFGTRKSNSVIFDTKDLNGRQTNQAKSFSNLSRFSRLARIQMKLFLPKPGASKFRPNKTIIINLILFPPSPVPRMIPL